MALFTMQEFTNTAIPIMNAGQKAITDPMGTAQLIPKKRKYLCLIIYLILKVYVLRRKLSKAQQNYHETYFPFFYTKLFYSFVQSYLLI